jgi:chromosome partitioning protein
MMKSIIAISNQKGGVGKSTTAHALGAGLSLKGCKTLMVDLDSQCNLTIATGADRDKLTCFEVLSKDIKAYAREAIQALDNANLAILPASNQLSTIADHLPRIGRYDQLKKALEPLKKEYDFIILDTPPALNDLTLNALMTADRVIIPAQADLFSLEAIKELAGTISEIKEYNNNLSVEGILLTRYQARSILTQEMTDVIKDTASQMQTRVFSRPIREAIAIKEAQAMHQDIFSYAPNSKVAEDYKAFIDELSMSILKDN